MYAQRLRERLRRVQELARASAPATTVAVSDTVVRPLLQMGPIGVQEEYTYLSRLLASQVREEDR